MSLFGMNGLDPGDKWVRTEQGWKRSEEVHANLRQEIARNIVLPPLSMCGVRSRSKWRSNGSRDVRSPALSMSSGSSSPRLKDWNIYFTNGFNENRFQLIQHSLAQRHVLIRKSSKESSYYLTISDAIFRLNFNGALLDTNCYPFICKVLTNLFVGKYWALSRSTHTTLLRLVETAYEIALETGLHTRSIRELIETAKKILEEGRSKVATELLIMSVDSQIEMLTSYQEQLSRQMSKRWDDIPDGIHSDCWRIIISYLTDPRDVLNLGKVNSKLHSITTEDAVWRSLTYFHYGNTMDDQRDLGEKSVGSKFQWLNIFQEKFMSWSVVEFEQSTHTDLPVSVSSSFPHIDFGSRSSVEGRLPGLDRPSHAVAVCQLCHSIFWRSYGHPCKIHLTSAKASVHHFTDIQPSQTAAIGVSPLEFLNLFHC